MASLDGLLRTDDSSKGLARVAGADMVGDLVAVRFYSFRVAYCKMQSTTSRVVEMCCLKRWLIWLTSMVWSNLAGLALKWNSATSHAVCYVSNCAGQCACTH